MNHQTLSLIFLFFAIVLYFVIGRTPEPTFWVIVILDAALWCAFVYFAFLNH